MRGLEEEGNPQHRVRVEHNKDTLLIHISGEDGFGWTTVAIDRASREWSIAQRPRQLDAPRAAYSSLYDAIARQTASERRAAAHSAMDGLAVTPPDSNVLGEGQF